MTQSYSLPTRVTFGDGCLERLPHLQPLADAKTVRLVTGGKSLRESGHLDHILAFLKSKKTELTEGIPAAPGVKDLEQLEQALRENPPDCIIAVGGGSVMDTAKAAAFCAAQQGDALQSLISPPAKARRPIPVVAIPTTAGTGSEVTPFSVFWEHETKQKYSLHHEFQYPADALVDPLLTYSMPPEVTATTGMDAFTQACEAYWNKNHNALSDDYALAAVSKIFPALPRAVQDGSDAAARHDMMLGSLQAGLAFSNTRTAACHSISYPMTLHFGVAHGQAVGLTLPEVLLLNAGAMPDRVARFCGALGVRSIEEAADTIRGLMERSGLQTRLSDLRIAEKDIELIVREGFTPERMGNNPFAFDAQSLRAMLIKIL